MFVAICFASVIVDNIRISANNLALKMERCRKMRKNAKNRVEKKFFLGKKIFFLDFFGGNI